jgi:hypothetical protein
MISSSIRVTAKSDRLSKHHKGPRQRIRSLVRICISFLAITIASTILIQELFTTSNTTWPFGTRRLTLRNLGKIQTTDVTSQLVGFESESNHESTIVIAYFELPRAKHSHIQYKDWLSFILCIEDAVVIFTSPDMVDYIKQFRSHAIDRTLIVPMNLTDIEIGNEIHYDDEFWEKQTIFETEGNQNRDYDLYKIWQAKVWFVNLAIELHPFNSRIYTWLDAGHFRDSNVHFCYKTLVRHPEIIPYDRIVLNPYRQVNPSDAEQYNSTTLSGPGFSAWYVAGGGFSGDIFAWPRFLKAFEKTVQLYVESGTGLCDDQPILQSTCMQNKDLCVVVRRDAPYGTGSPDSCKYSIPQCIENSGWIDKTSMVNGFFSFKFRLWHGGDPKTMYWDPSAGLPSEEENSSMYE